MNIINEIKANRKVIIISIIVFAIILFFSYARYNKDDFLTIPYYTIVTAVIYIFMLLMWAISISNRIIDKDVRNKVILLDFFLIFFVIIRSLKWEFQGSDFLEQFLWYLYYIPMIGGSLLLVLISFSFNRDLYERYIVYIRIITIFSGFLIVFVLTNNLHFQVFEIVEWANQYDVIKYKWGYKLIFIWMIFNFVLMNILFIKGSKLKNTKERLFAPFVVVFVYFVYTIFYRINPSYSGVGAIEFTVFFILVAVSLVESLIQVGLIPSNQGYVSLFKVTNIPMIIVDKKYELVDKSANNIPVDKSIYYGMSNGESIDIDDSRLSIAEIDSGYVLWVDDLTEINKKIRDIKDANAKLSLRNKLLKEQMDLKKKKVATQEKGRIYGNVEKAISSKKNQIYSLIDGINPENERQSLIKIALLCAYIKRLSNIVLLEEIYGYVDAFELENAIIETLHSYNIKSFVNYSNKFVDYKLDGELVRALYACFSDELVKCLDLDVSVEVFWELIAEEILFKFIFKCDKYELDDVFECSDKWKKLGARVENISEGNTKVINIYMTKVKNYE